MKKIVLKVPPFNVFNLYRYEEAPKAGVVIFGLPYQLIELHRKISDKKNVVTVLKPVKPSDFQRAITKLAALSQSGEMDWMHDSITEVGVVC